MGWFRKRIILLIAGVVIINFLGVVKSNSVSVHKKSAKEQIWNTVVSKLSIISNTYTVNEKQNLIQQAEASQNPSYDGATSYIAIDFDSGNVILEKNPYASVPIASLTKIMTAVVALDLASPTDEITISQDAANQIPTKIGVVPGQQMQLVELLEGMLLTSANDAATAVKDGINIKYNSLIFINAMNKKAALLGLSETHFENPAGLDDPNHYSSAHDLAILAHYALTNYPVIAEIVKKNYMFIPQTQTHKQFDLVNWNGLLNVYPNVFGVKIGNTDAAKTTTIVGSERSGHKILAVLLGAPDILSRDMWTADLLNDSFSKQYNLDPVEITQDALEAKYASWDPYL